MHFNRLEEFKVFADTGVLVAFSGIGEMRLLRDLFSEIWIPTGVRRELIDQGLGWKAASEVQVLIKDGFRVRTIDVVAQGVEVPVDLRLDVGESEVIAVASAFDGIALLDEVAARRRAEALNLRFVGSLGILRMAKDKRLIPAVVPIISEMRANGIRFGEDLLRRFLAEIGEA